MYVYIKSTVTVNTETPIGQFGLERISRFLLESISSDRVLAVRVTST